MSAARNYTLVEGKDIPGVSQVAGNGINRVPVGQDGVLYSERISSGERQTNDQFNQSNIEEVYICSCCGISRELKPSSKCLHIYKVLFYLFNFMVLAFALANLGMGLWLRIDPKVYEVHKYIETQNFTIAGWILLFGGFITFLVAIWGFGAATKQRVSLLLCYLVIMVPLTLIFVGTIVLFTVYGLGLSLEKVLVKEIYDQMRRGFMNSEKDLFEARDAAQFLDFVQVKLKCCGAIDFRDYSKLGMVVPTTCYSIDRNFINAPGCGHALRELLDLRAGLALGFNLGAIVSQMLAICMSTLIICSIYEWRAHPRPASPISQARQPEESYPLSLYQQRPRSRTPVVS